MMEYTEVVSHIVNRLEAEKGRLKTMWREALPVSHFYLDDLLPMDFAREISAGFPELSKMNTYQTLREKKASSADYSLWKKATRDAFLALQDEKVLAVMSEITEIRNLTGDPSAYAGGISMMVEGDFLNPHIDNSTHPKMKGYRRLNALYYVSPDWSSDCGGNLELWGPKLKQRNEITSTFNRLVVMNTNRFSLHSVNKVTNPYKPRLCVSNYYFTEESPHAYSYSHVTSFRGRPGEFLKDIYLRTEGKVASVVQGIVGKPLK